MVFTFENDADEMFFSLGKVAGYLTDPAHVTALAKALSNPLGGAQTRAALLVLHAVLGEVLAEGEGKFPTLQ